MPTAAKPQQLNLIARKRRPYRTVRKLAAECEFLMGEGLEYCRALRHATSEDAFALSKQWAGK